MDVVKVQVVYYIYNKAIILQTPFGPGTLVSAILLTLLIPGRATLFLARTGERS